MLPASFSLLFMMKMSIWQPVACVGMCLSFQLPVRSICWPSVSAHTVSVSVTQTSFHPFSGLGKVDVGKKSGIYLDYTLRLMCGYLIGSHRKGNSTPVFYTVKFPKQFNNISEMQIAQERKKRFTINKLFYDQISMNIYQMMRSGSF